MIMLDDQNFKQVFKKLDRPLVLVGMMGVGKTTIGRRLARTIGLDFIDCDQAIEEAAGMSVADIFESFGEAEFRAGERRVIARLMTEGPQVIATGGGAFVQDHTRNLIKKSAISIWLDAPIAILVERTGKRDTRPLLRGGNREMILQELLIKRRPAYSQADLHVESSEGPHQDVVERIIDTLQAWLMAKAPDQSHPPPSEHPTEKGSPL